MQDNFRDGKKVGANIIKRENLSPFVIGVVISSGIVFCLLAFLWPSTDEKVVQSQIPAEEIAVVMSEEEPIAVAEVEAEQKLQSELNSEPIIEQDPVITRLENKLLSLQEQLSKEQELRRALEIKLQELRKGSISTPTVTQTKAKMPKVQANHYTSAEKYILDMPSKNYTLQLFGSADEQVIKDFIAANKLSSTAHYFKSSYQGKPWYILITGNYSSRNSANAALDALPSKLKKVHPWPREYASIQSMLRKN